MKTNKLFSIVLAFVMLFSMNIAAYATDASVQINNNQRNVLYAVNQTVTETEQGFTVTLDLVQESEGKERLAVYAGIATFKITIDSTNTGGECYWSVSLTNGDLIKGVNGGLFVKQDWFGPFNPVSAIMAVNEYYSVGTLYSTAHGVEYFTFAGDAVFAEDKNIIFQWRDFTVTGVEDIYFIVNGEKQGEVSDFK